METVKHTPFTLELVQNIADKLIIRSANGTFIGSFYASEQSLVALIVTACNNHEDLLEACEGLFGLVESGDLVRDTSKDHKSSWVVRGLVLIQKLKAAQDAIAKAEGK